MLFYFGFSMQWVCWVGYLRAQGLAAHGFLAAQGLAAAQGFLAPHGLAAHGFLAAQGLPPQGLAIEAAELR